MNSTEENKRRLAANDALVKEVVAELDPKFQALGFKKSSERPGWKAEMCWRKGNARVVLSVNARTSHYYTPIYEKNNFRLQVEGNYRGVRTFRCGLAKFDEAVKLALARGAVQDASDEKSERKRKTRTAIVKVLSGGEIKDMDEFFRQENNISDRGDYFEVLVGESGDDVNGERGILLVDLDGNMIGYRVETVRTEKKSGSAVEWLKTARAQGGA